MLDSLTLEVLQRIAVYLSLGEGMGTMPQISTRFRTAYGEDTVWREVLTASEGLTLPPRTPGALPVREWAARNLYLWRNAEGDAWAFTSTAEVTGVFSALRRAWAYSLDAERDLRCFKVQCEQLHFAEPHWEPLSLHEQKQKLFLGHRHGDRRSDETFPTLTFKLIAQAPSLRLEAKCLPIDSIEGPKFVSIIPCGSALNEIGLEVPDPSAYPADFEEMLVGAKATMLDLPRKDVTQHVIRAMESIKLVIYLYR